MHVDHWREPHLSVITGPMFSGKSDELIRRLTVAKIGGHDAIVIKPARDTRTDAEIRSRNGGVFRAIVVDTADEILSAVGEGDQVIGIDEAQFFDEGIVDAVKGLLREGKRVYVAGLAIDFAERPFGHVSSLMSLATECLVLTAICMQCKNPNASRTKRLVESTEQQLVGDGESYEPRCLRCYHCK